MKAYQAHQVLMLESYLDRHDELLKASRATYNLYQGDRVEDLPFQRKLVNHALSQPKSWTAELATGIGKSVIGARIALERVKDGPVIYVCPSAAALGDRQSGIVNKFMRTFKSFGKPNLELGALNDLSRANDVSFMTPRALAHLLAKDRRRASEIMKRASCFIVDEAHHFPNDEKDELRTYGAIYDAASQLVRDGLTVAMTGTWERLDRMQVMGRATPDARLTVQDAVDLKRCPAIYGIQVVTDVVATKATSHGDLYDMHLTPEARQQYLDGVVACMHTVYKRYPVPFAAFARTRADAAVLVARFNQASRLGDRGLALLTGQVPMPERLRIIEEITAGRKVGYVTCAVGEEALDMPALEVVHLVRRTRSHVRNMQAIGRALRTCKGKRRALVVDYQTMLTGVTDRFLGLTLEDLVERQDSRIQTVVNGGPLVEQDNYQTCTFGGMTMSAERAVVCVNTSSMAKNKQELLRLAQTQAPRPHYTTTVGRALVNYTAPSSKALDQALTDKLKQLRPDWWEHSAAPDTKKTALLQLARTQQSRPKEGPLAAAAKRYLVPSSKSYDQVFAEAVRKLRPDWLYATTATIDDYKRSLVKRAEEGEQRPSGQEWGRICSLMRHDATFRNAILRARPTWIDAKKMQRKELKAQLRAAARAGAPRPVGSLGDAFVRHCTRKTSGSFDAELRAELQALCPAWFEASVVTTKRELFERARTGAPKPSLSDERHLYWSLWGYTRVGHKTYDEAFTKKLFALRPDWQFQRHRDRS